VSLEDARRQKTGQLVLPLDGRGEAPRCQRSGEASTAASGNERPGTDRLMEEVVQRGNAKAALKRVRQNKGSPGIDGMTVDELPKYLAEHWEEIREQLLAGTYQPKPVKRQEIPKSGGGVRELGIPCALDRFVQQAILQVLQPRFDPTFSEHSHGFRPGRRAHDAVCEAQRYIQDGRRVVVDVDLEKFFDRVNHDVLMGKLSARSSSGATSKPASWRTGWWWSGSRERRKAVLSHRSWQTCSSTKWTRSWRGADTPSCATPTTATCTCGRGGRASG
jgi:hypothetical protein